MIDQIRKKKVSVVVPTVYRDKLLWRFLRYWHKYSKMKIDFIFINNSREEKKIVRDYMAELILSSGNTFVDLHATPSSSVAKLRNIGIGYALDLKNKYILIADDDCYIGEELAIEKMIAPMEQEGRFWGIGTMWPHKFHMRDFPEDKVGFNLTNLSTLWMVPARIFQKLGTLDERLKIRDDNEFAARIWHNGGWTGTVANKVTHRRWQGYENDAVALPKNESEDWHYASEKIAWRYPNVFQNRNGRLYKQFKFPDRDFRMTERLELYELESD